MADYQHYLQELEDIGNWEMINGRRARRFVERGDPFSLDSDEEFLQRYRLSKAGVRDLLQRIQAELPTSNNRLGKYAHSIHQNYSS